jgi:hypothetical protein
MGIARFIVLINTSEERLVRARNTGNTGICDTIQDIWTQLGMEMEKEEKLGPAPTDSHLRYLRVEWQWTRT